MKGDLVRVH